jgi:hypothetical protein
MVGDVVYGNGDEGEVLQVTEKGLGGEETATVQWKTVREKVPGIFELPAPIAVPTRALSMVRPGR